MHSCVSFSPFQAKKWPLNLVLGTYGKMTDEDVNLWPKIIDFKPKVTSLLPKMGLDIMPGDPPSIFHKVI